MILLFIWLLTLLAVLVFDITKERFLSSLLFQLVLIIFFLQTQLSLLSAKIMKRILKALNWASFHAFDEKQPINRSHPQKNQRFYEKPKKTAMKK